MHPREPAEAAAAGLAQPGAGEAQTEGRILSSISFSHCCAFMSLLPLGEAGEGQLNMWVVFLTHPLNTGIAVDISKSQIYDSLNQGIVESLENIHILLGEVYLGKNCPHGNLVLAGTHITFMVCFGCIALKKRNLSHSPTSLCSIY